MAVDLSVLDGYKSIVDQQQLQEAFELKKALAIAEIGKAMKPADFDVKSLGQQALVKQQLGLPLSAQDLAFAKVYSATTESVYTDLYGNAARKPGVMERLGSPQPSTQPTGVTGSPPPNLPPMNSPQADEVVTDLFGNGNNTGMDNVPPPAFRPTMNAGVPVSDIPPNAGMDDAPNEWDLQYQQQRAALLASGDKRSAQALDLAYSKSKMEMNDVQGKAAAFADRMFLTNPILEKTTAAGLDDVNVRADRNLPDFLANRVVSKDYQSFNREQRDFINAQLRRESGAVISPTEFESAIKQYIPTVGDGPDVLARKKAAREQAATNMAREAGPAYKRVKPTAEAPPTPKISQQDALNELMRREKAKKK